MNLRKSIERQRKVLDQHRVRYDVLDEAETQALLMRFSAVFVDPKLRDMFGREILRAGDKKRDVDYESYLRSGSAIAVEDTQTILQWLMADAPLGQCYRFDLRPSMPALRVELATLDPAWATSWPGILVNFDTGRALLVTLDMERVACDSCCG